MNARESVEVTSAPEAMSAIRLHPPGTVEALALERVGIPRVGAGEALVRVHAAAITRDELEWPVDRLPAIPSYELSGTIAVDASTASDLAVGDASGRSPDSTGTAPPPSTPWCRWRSSRRSRARSDTWRAPRSPWLG
jgi:hypothetical protein